MGARLRALIVEDSDLDTLLVIRALQQGGYAPELQRVETAAAMEEALDHQSWDVVIADHALPHFDAPSALALLQRRGMDLPFIIVSGRIGEEEAVAAMRAGAHDYILKRNLLRLAPAIERELREAVGRRERRRAEARRDELLAQVERALALRNQFLSMAAHELKSPLTSLRGYAQLLQKQARARNDPDLLSPLTVINRQLDRLTGLVNDLFELSWIESGRMSIRMEPFDLNIAARETLDEVSTAYPDFSLRLQKHPGGVRVRGDRARIQEVLMNLLANAVKYSDKRKEVDILIRPEGEHVRVEVTDYGIGIPEAQQSEVFELYFRGSNAPGNNYDGLGIGLYISRSIVERHGGSIGVRSREGGGTTIYFTLPAIDAPESQARRGSDPAPPPAIGGA